MNVKNLKYISLTMSFFGLAILVLNLFHSVSEWYTFFFGGILIFLGLANFFMYSKRQ